MAGSSWKQDEEIITEYINRFPASMKWVFAPHEIDESNIVRLEKLLKVVRKQVLAGLVARGMNRSQAEEALESDVRYLQVDVTKKLQENRPAAFQPDKGSR